MTQSSFNSVSADDWVKRWEDRNIGFHRSNVDVLLNKHVDHLVNGRQNLKIFLPFCGKSLDLKWLWEQGHTVIGVEVAEMAIKEFFDEQSISYTTCNIPNIKGTLYVSEDKQIKLYCCDFFDFNRSCEGLMDAIWDRAALVAVNREDRIKYADAMKNLMTPDCRYLLETLDYDETKYGGPPFFVSIEQIKELYGEHCIIEDIDLQDAFVKEKHKDKWGIDSLYERLTLLTLK